VIEQMNALINGSNSMSILLLNKGLISQADHTRAVEIRTLSNARFAETLVRLGMISEAELAGAFALQTGVPLIGPADLAGDPIPLDGLNPSYLFRRKLLPLALEEGKLTLAMADPEDVEARDALAVVANAEQVEVMVGAFSDIEEALARAFPADRYPEGSGFGTGPGDEELGRLTDADSEAPVIRMVHRLLTTAASRGVSDIHIEPMARHLSIRFRIDGRLTEVERHAEGIASSIASRIKVMAGLDIAETRLPQDGRLRVTVRGRDVDVRVSTSPIAHGESIVLRLLGQSTLPLDLDKIGLPSRLLERLTRALAKPHGMILLTGPTGSGKTTTLYSAINHLRSPDVKIVTVEDPVEVVLEGVNQVHVRPDINLTYANALRAFLRQDPDILMIGEIRDRETADIAMRAALTGHLVLSTLHTNSATGAFTRLADIGIEPFLTASTVIASIAQRLVRKLCQECAGERSPTAAEVELFGRVSMDVPQTVRVPNGCASCGHSGYKGRIPIMEIVEIDETAREAIRSGRIEELDARQAPADTLFGHGLALVAEGDTDLVEVERAVQL
jgi:general secretion pathway protein E